MKEQIKDYIKDPPHIYITKTTLDRLKDEPNSGDCLALYAWYCYTAVWQKTNIVWANVSYMVKITKWSIGKVRKIRGQLLKLKLIEDIQKRDEDGNFSKRYVRVLYFMVLRENGSTGNDTTKYLDINTKVLKINNVKRIHETSKSSRSKASEKLIKKESNFYLSYGKKIQAILKLKSKHSSATPTAWSKEILFVIHDMNVGKDRFKEVMKWFWMARKDKRSYPYCPQIFKVKELSEKFRQIENQFEQHLDINKKSKNSADNITSTTKYVGRNKKGEKLTETTFDGYEDE